MDITFPADGYHGCLELRADPDVPGGLIVKADGGALKITPVQVGQLRRALVGQTVALAFDRLILP